MTSGFISFLALMACYECACQSNFCFSNKQTPQLHLQARNRLDAGLALSRCTYLVCTLAVNRSPQGGDRVSMSCGERCDNAKNAARYELRSFWNTSFAFM